MPWLDFIWWAGVAQILGGLILGGYLLAALVSLIPSADIPRARLLIAEGVVTGLSFLVAASILRTMALQTWPQILAFGQLLSLRLLLKRVFVWERRRLLARL